MDNEVKSDGESQEKQNVALDLNFTPAWARTPPENSFSHQSYTGGEDRQESRRGGRPSDRRSMRRPSAPRDDAHHGKDRRAERKGPPQERGRPPRVYGAKKDNAQRGPAESSPAVPHSMREQRAPRGPRREFVRREPVPRLNVQVSFLPDRERLSLVVRDIQVTRRAFPLMEIAGRFLTREDSYLVKLEFPSPKEGETRITLFQCQACHRAFRHRNNAEAHIIRDHLDKWFVVEEVEQEPPSGNFSCVARCRLSGELLGPPNYHAYNERIQELWSTRFAHLSKADYLAQIETLRDEGVVEQWKESIRKQIIYRFKIEPVAASEVKPETETSENIEPEKKEELPPMTRREAEDWVRTNKLKGLLREASRCIVPGSQSRVFDDGALRAAVAAARQREERFPFSLSLALRPAFRHMRLHLFKVNKKETYVTAVLPKSADLSQMPAVVKEILAYVEAHPHCTRQQILENLRPGMDPEHSDAAEIILHIGNLASHGGLIEFYNGTLLLPRVTSERDVQIETEGKVEESPIEKTEDSVESESVPTAIPEPVVQESESQEEEPKPDSGTLTE